MTNEQKVLPEVQNPATSNPHIVAGIMSVLEGNGAPMTMDALRQGVIEHLQLTEEQLNVTFASGKNKQFNARFSARISDLILKQHKLVRDGKLITLAEISG